MEGKIASYKRNRHTIKGNHMILRIKGIDSKDKAKKLIGKKVEYDTGKKKISGIIKSAHGNSGAVRVIFETGMPGQALGKTVSMRE